MKNEIARLRIQFADLEAIVMTKQTQVAAHPEVSDEAEYAVRVPTRIGRLPLATYRADCRNLRNELKWVRTDRDAMAVRINALVAECNAAILAKRATGR